METGKIDIDRGGKAEQRAMIDSMLRPILADPSLQVLLFSNAVTIYLAITGHWNLPSVMFVYWQQSVTIGFFTFVKMLQLKNFSTEGLKMNDKPTLPTRKTKIQAAFFFLFHYGIFHAVYFGFLAGMFSMFAVDGEMKSLFLAAAIFFLNHLFSYLYNRPWVEENQNLGTVMMLPYVRIIPMHLTIIFAVPLGFFFGPTAALSIFLVLKTFTDALMHIFEHAKDRVLAVKLSK